MDLVDFLLARFAEDEGAVRAAMTPAVYQLTDDAYSEMVELAQNEGANDAAVEYAQRFDPARILAECQVKRRTIAEHERAHGECLNCRGVHGDEWTNEPYPCRTLRLLALPYADHQDYRAEWRP